MVRLQITLDPKEADQLAKLAAAELRDPRDQARLIIREELQRRGKLSNTLETDCRDKGDRSNGS